jgi:uncharacterized membrane protein
MEYFYLLLAMTFSALITVSGRLYNNKNRELEYVTRLYSLLASIFAAIGWLVLWLTDFSFDARVLPYSALYGVLYACFTVGMLGAIKVGSTSLTGLVKQVALVGVSFWGYFFWDTQFTTVSAIGIVVLLISLALCLLVKEKKTDDHHLGKWLFYALLITIGNAGCGILQRYQQMHFNYQHKNMLMFFSYVFAICFCFVFSLGEKKENWKRAIKQSWAFPALSGISSAGSNLFILLLVKCRMSPVILYPGIAVGGLIITTLIAFFGFREKLRPQQWVGLAVGAVALVLLNL